MKSVSAGRKQWVIRHCGPELLEALLELKELISLKLIDPKFRPSKLDELNEARFFDKIECFALTATLGGYFQLLPAILPKFLHLLELQLAPLNFGEKEAQGLTEAIATLPMLRNLAVKNIDMSAISPLASMLRSMTGLRQFSVQGYIANADAASLLQALSSMQLEQLVLDIPLGDAAAKALSARLSMPECALLHLQMRSALSLPVAQELMRGISGNTSLETLMLKLIRQNYHMESSSSSSDDSDSDDHSANPEVRVATLIAKTIPEARGLRRLCISLQGLRPQRVAAIASALLSSPTVLELDLTENNWDAKTSAIFLEGLEKNLVLLDVRVPVVEPEVSKKIGELLQRNRINKSVPDGSIS